MSKVRKILAILENLAFFVFCMVLILFLVQLFCFTSFKIPSDSMEPVLKDGDRILVNKMIKGARLFNVFAALDNEDFTIHRMPGWGNFKRNDILVFNFPYQQNRWDSIRMDVMQYYVKRCIALLGDILEISGGFYKKFPTTIRKRDGGRKECGSWFWYYLSPVILRRSVRYFFI